MKELSKRERKILADVEKYGVSTIGVFDPDGTDPHFQYSIGFTHSYRQPECIILGLNLDLMHSMINALGQQLKDGLALTDGAEIDGLLGGDFLCIAKPVAHQYIIADYFNSALWHNRYRGGFDDDFKPMQIIWPGAVEGRYPWQSEEVAALQPLLCDVAYN